MASDGGTVNLFGLRVHRAIDITASGLGTVNVYGSRFQVDHANVPLGPLVAESGTLTGTLHFGNRLNGDAGVSFQRLADTAGNRGVIRLDHLGMVLMLDDPTTPGGDVIVADDKPLNTPTPDGDTSRADQAAAAGLILYQGPVGRIPFVIALAVSDPLLPDQLLFHVLTFGPPATLTAKVTATGFQGVAGTNAILAPIAGFTSGAVTFTEAVTPSDTTAPVSAVFGPFGRGAFSNTGRITFALEEPTTFYLTKTLVISSPLAGLTGVSAFGIVAARGEGASLEQPPLPGDTRPGPDVEPDLAWLIAEGDRRPAATRGEDEGSRFLQADRPSLGARGDLEQWPSRPTPVRAVVDYPRQSPTSHSADAVFEDLGREGESVANGAAVA